MNKKIYFRALLLLVALLTVGLTACTKDDAEGTVTLRYPEISDIGPSMTYNSNAPSYHGAIPEQFAIEGVTFDGAAFNDVAGSFTINAANGAVSIGNTSELLPGLYCLSISCVAGGQRNFFADIFRVRMLPGTPQAVKVTPEVLEIPYDGAKNSKLTAQITPEDKTVTFNSYELIQEEGKEYFAVSKTGAIGVNAAFKGEILPGVYTPTLKLSSLAGTATYENTVSLKIASKPLEIAYKPVMGRSEVNMAFSSPVPTVKGSTDEGVQWAIASVTPDTDKFAIDPATGVISLPADNGLAVDDEYKLDLTVANQYGSAEFIEAYVVKIVAYITPIDPSKFGYNDAETIQGVAFEFEKKDGFVGDEVTFELGELVPALVGKIAIDDQTGAISAKKGNTIPVGTYSIPVKASNTKGEVIATATLVVKDNPYYFTTISYGNNLGLTPAANYPSQFRCTAPEQIIALSGMLPTTDAKKGTTIEWSLKLMWKMAETTIDASTGALIFTDKAYDVKAHTGLIFVTATAGKGEVGETSITIPVFFVTHPGTVDDVTVYGAPMVITINPKSGGVGAPLKISGVADMSKFMIDFRRTFQYYNLNGPASHVNGQPAAGTFLGEVWKAYFAVKPPVNYGARSPLSYYDNKTELSRPALYMDPLTLGLRVNPEKFRTEDGYANGMLTGEMTFVTDGVESNLGNSTGKIRPIWIWFDEKF